MALQRHLCVVTYDISGDKSRRRLAALIENYGDRVLESVYACFIDAKERSELQAKARVIVGDRGRLIFWPVCPEDARDMICLGTARLTKPAAYVVT